MQLLDKAPPVIIAQPPVVETKTRRVAVRGELPLISGPYGYLEARIDQLPDALPPVQRPRKASLAAAAKRSEKAALRI
jgi:hypothetical protein